MKNYRPILRQYSELDLLEFVLDYTQTIVYRTYEDGSSVDTRRKTIPYEETILENLMFAALFTIRNNDDAAQAAIDMAEVAVDKLLPGVNGYMSMYIPLHDILNKMEQELKTKEENAC